MHETTTLLHVTCQIFTDFNFFTFLTQQLTFLNLVIKTPPHLKCVATLPCNLLLMACFADINISKGSVAIYARCGGILNIHLSTNLLRNIPVNFFKSVKI